MVVVKESQKALKLNIRFLKNMLNYSIQDIVFINYQWNNSFGLGHFSKNDLIKLDLKQLKLISV